VTATGTAKLAQWPNCGNGIGLALRQGNRKVFRFVLTGPEPLRWTTGQLSVRKGDTIYLTLDANSEFSCDSTLLNLIIRQVR
jgi:hypothetical protein